MAIDANRGEPDERTERDRLERLLIESEQRLATIPTLTAQIADLEHALVVARGQTAAADERARRLDEQLSDREQAIVEMLNSPSWQVTKPLRRAQKMLR